MKTNKFGCPKCRASWPVCKYCSKPWSEVAAFAVSEVRRALDAIAKPGKRNAELEDAETWLRNLTRREELGTFDYIQKKVCTLADEMLRLRTSLSLAEQEKQALQKSADTWRDKWATMNTHYHDRDKEARALRAEVERKGAALREMLEADEHYKEMGGDQESDDRCKSAEAAMRAALSPAEEDAS